MKKRVHMRARLLIIAWINCQQTLDQQDLLPQVVPWMFTIPITLHLGLKHFASMIDLFRLEDQRMIRCCNVVKLLMVDRVVVRFLA